MKKGVLKNFAKFTGKQMSQKFFYEINCFSMNFQDHLFHRTPPVAAFM